MISKWLDEVNTAEIGSKVHLIEVVIAVINKDVNAC